MKTRIKIVIEQNEHLRCYKGIDESNNNQLFKHCFAESNIGIVEFIGAIHALMYSKKHNLNAIVIVSNDYIKESIEKQTYKHNSTNEHTQSSLRRAKNWLIEQKSGLDVETQQQTQ